MKSYKRRRAHPLAIMHCYFLKMNLRSSCGFWLLGRKTLEKKIGFGGETMMVEFLIPMVEFYHLSLSFVGVWVVDFLVRRRPRFHH
jgi:hypothetical protein